MSEVNIIIIRDDATPNVKSYGRHKAYTEKFYSDIPLMKLINEVNLKVKQGE